jgi:Domain of unknown function (DUF4399)
MLMRLTTLFALILIAGCGQDTAVEAPAETAPAATPTPAAATAPALVRRAAPAGAMAYIIAPADGATVSSPVHVVFGLKGAGIAPAGVEREGTGHHHLLIDTDLPDLGQPIPADDQHRHFGAGQTEADIELAPGRHTLQLLLGDERHVPHDPPITSERITIEVR